MPKLNISRVNYKTEIGPFENVRLMTVTHELVNAEIIVLDGWKDTKMFIARTMHKNGYAKRKIVQWFIYDFITGMALGWGHTNKDKETLIPDVLSRINSYGKVAYMEKVKEFTDKYGVANE